MYACGPGRLPEDRPKGSAEVVDSLTCHQPYTAQSPEGEEASRQDVSPREWEVTCGEGCSQLSSPGHLHKKVLITQACPTLWDPMDCSLQAPLSM